jgi:hypothetical protein
VSARKNPDVVEETTDEGELTETTVEPTLDPELDRVPETDETDETDVAVEDAESDSGPEGDAATSGRGRGKLVIGAVIALLVAVAAVLAAGALGEESATGLPDNITDPAVVLTTLEQGGIECSGAAISGQVATCNATVAVRLFESPAEAEDWVSELLKDPLTSSAIGWVRHDNVVVAVPLDAAPDVSAALGKGSQIY